MNSELLYLAQAIFKNAKVIEAIGFSQKEAVVLYFSLQGLSNIKISELVNLSEQDIQQIKRKCLPKVPTLLHQKLDILTNVDLSTINFKLLELNAQINNFTKFYEEIKVYHLRTLKISKHLKIALIIRGIKTTADLSKIKESELLMMKNIGKNSVEQLKVELGKLNIRLKE